MPWLLKTEPDTYSIDDLARDRRTWWDGVRNFQARNLMRDEMRVGDRVLLYHSSSDPIGVAGIARVSAAAKADDSALDPKSGHFDPKATRTSPIWSMVQIEFVERFPAVVELSTLRGMRSLAKMALLRRGQRLSVQPVTDEEFDVVLTMGRSKPGSARTPAKRRAADSAKPTRAKRPAKKAEPSKKAITKSGASRSRRA